MRVRVIMSPETWPNIWDPPSRDKWVPKLLSNEDKLAFRYCPAKFITVSILQSLAISIFSPIINNEKTEKKMSHYLW